VSNPVVHWQLISREPEKLAQFYLTLFGWKISDANGLGYRMVETAQSGKGVDGGIWPAPPGAPEMVQLFVEVDDIDAALAQLTGLGGSVVMPKQVLPEGDAMALATDPLGRPFGLMTARR